MLNLFGAIATGLGRMLPGYLNGYRMAIQDNWNDLNQYNKVQQGQIQNAWSEAAFNPSYNQLLADTAMHQMNAIDAGGELGIKQLQWPGRAAQAAMMSSAAPGLTAAGINNTFGLYQQNAFERGLQQQMLPWYWQGLFNTQQPRYLPWSSQQPQQPMTPPSVQDPNAELRGRAGLPTVAGG